MAVLAALMRSKLPLTTRELSRRTGIPERSVRYYLRQMAEAGLVERRGRQPYAVYVITPAGAEVYHLLRRKSGRSKRSRTSGKKHGEGWCGANSRCHM